MFSIRRSLSSLKTESAFFLFVFFFSEPYWMWRNQPWLIGLSHKSTNSSRKAVFNFKSTQQIQFMVAYMTPLCLLCMYVHDVSMCVCPQLQPVTSVTVLSSQKSDSRASGGYSKATPPLIGTSFWQALCRAAHSLKTPTKPISCSSLVTTVTYSERMCPVVMVKEFLLFPSYGGGLLSVMLVDGHGFNHDQKAPPDPLH